MLALMMDLAPSASGSEAMQAGSYPICPEAPTYRYAEAPRLD